MNVEYIDITSYRGISSNAEHYYAKVAVFDDRTYECFIAGEHPYTFDKELLFYPDREQAIQLCKKDNKMAFYEIAVSEEQIEDMMKNGTIRFPNVLEVVRQARKQYPNAILKFYMYGYERNFAIYLDKLNKWDKETVSEIIDLLKDIK